MHTTCICAFPLFFQKRNCRHVQADIDLGEQLISMFVCMYKEHLDIMDSLWFLQNFSQFPSSRLWVTVCDQLCHPILKKKQKKQRLQHRCMFSYVPGKCIVIRKILSGTKRKTKTWPVAEKISMWRQYHCLSVSCIIQIFLFLLQQYCNRHV